MRILTGLATSLALLGLVACGQTAETEAPASEAPAAEAAATPAVAPGELEVGLDRPGADIETLYDVTDAQGCQAACEANTDCRAFTFVQAGIQAETPVCWLKDRAPPTIEAEWATSGVMVGREAPAEG